MATSQTARVLELIKRFNNGQKVCIEHLQNDINWWNDSKNEPMSEKSIRRDLDVIKEYFPESFELIRGGKGEKGCYKAVTQSVFENFLKPDALSLLVQTFSIAQRSQLFDSFNMDDSDRRIVESKIKEVNRYYEFKNKPFETKKDDMVIFKKLEHSIKHQKCIILDYEIGNKIESVEVKPYKIVFMNENFYIACEVEHELYQFSIYRISKIKQITDTRKTYQKNLDIDDFIKHMQTPFAVYKKDFRKYFIDIKLEVNAKKAFFFKAKKFLPSQNIIEEKEDGSLIINYKVTQELEIEELVKRWIPYVKVIEPISLKEKIENELKEYLGINQ